MNIIEWHMEGGLGYMLTLSFLFVFLVILFGRYLFTRHHNKTVEAWIVKGIRQVGLFCFFFGLFIQIVGLIQGFNTIEAAGDISPGLLAGGLKVSFYPTAYGLLILLVSQVFYFYITRTQTQRPETQPPSGE